MRQQSMLSVNVQFRFDLASDLFGLVRLCQSPKTELCGSLEVVVGGESGFVVG